MRQWVVADCEFEPRPGWHPLTAGQMTHQANRNYGFPLCVAPDASQIKSGGPFLAAQWKCPHRDLGQEVAAIARVHHNLDAALEMRRRRWPPQEPQPVDKAVAVVVSLDGILKRVFLDALCIAVAVLKPEAGRDEP